MATAMGLDPIPETPLVSVVTPAYNAEEFLVDTLESVRRQEYTAIEHIVVDDGSTDGTASILKSYEREYNLRWFSKRNEGQAITVNKAFDSAEGEIVAWLNADDVLFYRKAIADVVQTFRRTQVGVVYGHMAIIDEHNRLQKILYAPPRLNLGIVSLGHFAACVFYRRQVASSYKLNPAFRFALDYDQLLRMAEEKMRFGYLDKPLIGWRRHSSARSVSGRQNLKRETELLVRAHGASFGFRRLFMKALLYPSLLGRKIYGAKDVLAYCVGKKRLSLAFALGTDSVAKLLFRQLLPYT